MSIIQTLQGSILTNSGSPPPPPIEGIYYYNGGSTAWGTQLNMASQTIRFSDGTSAPVLYFNTAAYTVSQSLNTCNDIEVDLWIYPMSNNRIIVTEQGQPDENTGYHYVMIEIDNTSRIRARSWPQTGMAAIISDPITLNAWHHIYFRHSSGQARLEVDGVLSGTDNYARTPPGVSHIGIGTYSVTGITNNNRFHGRTNFVQVRNFNFVGSSWAGSNLQYRPSLQFELDANNPNAYNVGTPTVWNDTSGNSNNCTLYGSPTYVNVGPNYFTFNRNSFQYGQIPTITGITRWTVEAVYRISEPYTNIRSTSVITTIYDLADGGATPDYGYVNYCIGTTGNAEFSANWYGQFFDNVVWRQTQGSFVGYANTWFHIIVTYDGENLQLYKNGSAVGAPGIYYDNTLANGGAIRIARRWDGVDSEVDNYFPGDIGIVRLWFGAMSPGDVLKQYNQAVSAGYPGI